MKKFSYKAISPRQSSAFKVFSFCAKASEIFEFSSIDRIGRNDDGTLKGFQRSQVTNHIKEIRSYLSQEEAVLPNSIVIAFTKGVKVSKAKQGIVDVEIQVKGNEPNGLIVDGQQRLTALQGLPEKDFEVFVSCLLCENEDELRKQFILINNSKPLPKALIYELLPTVDGLPHRLSSRADAASIVERLNYDENSSLHGQIKQHTNPTGQIQDTLLQKLIMNSISDGAIRMMSSQKDSEEKSILLISNFFKAVQEVFSSDWKDRTPRTSRLVHGAGLIALGYVMEYIYEKEKSIDTESFKPYLEKIKPYCAWTEGEWDFGDGYKKPWNNLQNLAKDYMELSQYLIRILKRSM